MTLGSFLGPLMFPSKPRMEISIFFFFNDRFPNTDAVYKVSIFSTYGPKMPVSHYFTDVWQQGDQCSQCSQCWHWPCVFIQTRLPTACSINSLSDECNYKTSLYSYVRFKTCILEVASCSESNLSLLRSPVVTRGQLWSGRAVDRCRVSGDDDQGVNVEN